MPRILKYILFVIIAGGLIYGIFWLYQSQFNAPDPQLPTPQPDPQTNQPTEGNQTGTDQSPTQDSPDTQDTQNSRDPSDGNQPPATGQQETIEVTTVIPDREQISYLQTSGSVQSTKQIEIFPLTSATLRAINVQTGETVQAGEIIFELTGSNQSIHPTEGQLKVAEKNLEQAEQAYSTAQASYQTGKKTAQVQLESALNQAEAFTIDLATIDQNAQGIIDGLNILEDSLNNTRRRNSRSLAKMRNDIDDLIQNINVTQDRKAVIEDEIEDLGFDLDELNRQIKKAPPEDQESLQQELQQLQSRFEAARAERSGLNESLDQFYSGLEESRLGYESMVNGNRIGDNQLITQIQQSQNQLQVLNLNKDRSITSIGFDGQTTDPLKLAEQNYQNTLIQLDSQLTQATTSLELARVNYQLAKINTDSLEVKAPVSGVIGTINNQPGDQVSPQTLLTQIIDNRSFELEVGIDPESAELLQIGDRAEIEYAGRFIPAPITSISPSADSQSKLVTVKIKLPNISFRNNQNLNARIPLNISRQASNSGIFIPLDAVIIGSLEQYVYVSDNGQARKVNVELGEFSGDFVEIKSGLSGDDHVIVQGAKDLTDGQPIIVGNQPNINQ